MAKSGKKVAAAAAAADDGGGADLPPSRLSLPAFIVTVIGCCCILFPPCAFLIRTHWERYAPAQAAEAWFVGDESHAQVCWLFPSGQPGAGTPSRSHCVPFVPQNGRRVRMNSFVGHCFGFLDAGGAVVGRTCVKSGVTEYSAEPLAAEVLRTASQAAQELLDSAAAVAFTHRKTFYRVLQAALLANAFIFSDRSASSSGRHVPASPILTTHHMWLSFAVITMLADHFAKGVWNDVGSWLTLPAQYIGAPLFYHLAGANQRADSLATKVALVAAHAAILELMPYLPGMVTPYTLCTIAVIRVLKLSAKAPCTATIWKPLLHAALAGMAVTLSDFLGGQGLDLAYGGRFLLWGAAAHYRAQSLVWRDAAGCAALPYELAALVLHTHLTAQNTVGHFVRSHPSWRLSATILNYSTPPLLLLQSFALHRYRYRKLVDLGQGSRLLARMAYFLAHHSLAVYVIHIGALLVYDQFSVLRGWLS